MTIKTGDIVLFKDRDGSIYNAIATTIHSQDYIDLIGAIEVKSLSPPWAHIVERQVPRGTDNGTWETPTTEAEVAEG